MISSHKIYAVCLSLIVTSTAVIAGGITDDDLAALLAAGLITILLKEGRARSAARSAALHMRTFPRYAFAPEWALYANARFARFPMESMQLYRSLPYIPFHQPFF